MGLEARCDVSWRGATWTAAVHLDSSSVEVRGRPRLQVPFADIRHVRARSGALTLDTVGGELILQLGSAAEGWAKKIENPPSRAKKLGVKAEQRVGLVGLKDAELEADLVAAGAHIVGARAKADLVFLGAATPSDLERLAALRNLIEPDGAIWLVRTKGKSATVKEGDVMAKAREAGLVDIKVVAFSSTQSADKLVIPVAERPAKRGRARRD